MEVPNWSLLLDFIYYAMEETGNLADAQKQYVMCLLDLLNLGLL